MPPRRLEMNQFIRTILASSRKASIPPDSRVPLASSASGKSRNLRMVTSSRFSGRSIGTAASAKTMLRPLRCISSASIWSANSLRAPASAAICCNSPSLIPAYSLVNLSRSCSRSSFATIAHHTRTEMILQAYAVTRRKLRPHLPDHCPKLHYGHRGPDDQVRGER